MGRERKRWLMLWMSSGLMFAVVAYCGYFAVHRNRWRFEERLRVGMSMLEVEQAVGIPYQIVAADSILGAWGNEWERQVEDETWV